jgi:Ammonium Transporter Family
VPSHSATNNTQKYQRATRSTARCEGDPFPHAPRLLSPLIRRPDLDKGVAIKKSPLTLIALDSKQHYSITAMSGAGASSLYNLCRADGSDAASLDSVLQCYSQHLSGEAVVNKSYARNVLLLYAASMVFFMQAGFAMICAGAVQKKNVQNTMLKNLLDACGASVAFFSVGFALAFGDDDPSNPNKSFMGRDRFFLVNVEDYSFWLFQFAFSAASTTIVAGTLAERSQMVAYLCYSVMLSGWVYPIIVHSIWSHQGFLSAFSLDPLWGSGMIDFAGSGVVHMTGGTTALVAAIILGPRRGRFHDDAGRRLPVPKTFPGHSVALQVRRCNFGSEFFCSRSRLTLSLCRCLVHLFYGLVGTDSIRDPLFP